MKKYAIPIRSIKIKTTTMPASSTNGSDGILGSDGRKIFDKSIVLSPRHTTIIPIDIALAIVMTMLQSDELRSFEMRISLGFTGKVNVRYASSDTVDL